MKIPLLAVLLAAVALPAFACDEMGELRRAMAQARASSADARREAARGAIAEAFLLKNVMERYLTPVYFPGVYDMSSEPVVIDATDGADYLAVSARNAFLRGAPGARITLAPGKERSAQFAALKADYAAALARASVHLQAAGENPAEPKWIWGLAEWGVETQVREDKTEYSVLTRVQRDAVLKPTPASPPEPRDPHE